MRRTCVDCGHPITGENRCKTCHNRYANRMRYQLVALARDKPCEHCGQPIGRKPGGNDRARFCSLKCYNASRPARERGPNSRVSFPACQQCGTVFCSRRGTKYCSDQCRVQYNIDRSGQRTKDLYRLACEVGANGAMWRQLLIGALRERDGDLCALCWAPIDFGLKSGPMGDDLGYSIEHLTPRSKGGTDDLDNLALSHWGCNRDRKAKPIDVLWRAG